MKNKLIDTGYLRSQIKQDKPTKLQKLWAEHLTHKELLKDNIKIVNCSFTPERAEQINEDLKEKEMECPICKERKAGEGHYVLGKYRHGNVPIHVWVCDDCYNKYFTVENLRVEVIL